MTELLQTLGLRNRHGVEAVIERLIDLLDEVDLDSDLEPEPDEPYLADSITDREDDQDSGIGDGDGLIEQLPGWHGAAV